MSILGIALIGIGLALLCSGLIFYRSSEAPDEEGDQTMRKENGAASPEEKKEAPRENER